MSTHAFASSSTSTSHVYTPPQTSLAYRNQLAKLLTPLRRVTPRVPFWRLAAHRIPVLWSLYRGLLREAPSAHIEWRVKTQFREHRHLTSPEETKKQLLKAHRLADVMAKAKAGDGHWDAVLKRYSSLLAAKRDNYRWKEIVEKEIAHQEFLRTRPIITGFFRPTLYNGPLPRLKPQPQHISGMIARRRRRRYERQEKYEELRQMRAMLVSEGAFETSLQQHLNKSAVERGDEDRVAFNPVFANHVQEWVQPLVSIQETIRSTFARDEARLNSAFSPELLTKINEARRERARNLLRERRREIRGEIVKKTLKRARKGPPAHVLSIMTPRQRHLDRVARSSVSQVGYIGWAKKQLGWKLKNPDPWAAETGRTEDQERLDAIEKEIVEENARRLAALSEKSKSDDSKCDIEAKAPKP